MDAPANLFPVLHEPSPRVPRDCDRSIDADDSDLVAAQFEYSMSLTLEERILRLDEMLRFLAELQAGMPHVPAER